MDINNEFQHQKFLILRNFIKENKDKIDWEQLSTNPNAIELLKENKDKINWISLSMNPNAIEILKKNQDKIDWKYLSYNPSIFTYDYKKIKKHNLNINREVIEYVFHPSRISYEKILNFCNEII